MASMVTFINAVSMVLIAASTLEWSGTTEETGIYLAVAFLQILVLFGESCSMFWSCT